MGSSLHQLGNPVMMLALVSVLRIVLIVLAAWVTTAWALGAVYVAATYLEALRHVQPQTRSGLLRSLLRECWIIVWTQPLLPLFQLAGRRLSRNAGGTPIVLVHGYFQNRVDFLYLAKRLRAAGSGPLYACNFFWPQPFERSSVTVRDFAEKVRRETGAEKIDLLTHSSGGLLALDLLGEHPEWVHRVCVIAIPWRGVTWRGPVIGPSGAQLRAGSPYTRNRPSEIRGCPVLSVYSVHDNLVHPPETSRLVGPDVCTREFGDLGHLGLLFDREVGDAVCEFLLPPDADPARP